MKAIGIMFWGVCLFMLGSVLISVALRVANVPKQPMWHVFLMLLLILIGNDAMNGSLKVLARLWLRVKEAE